MSLDSSLSGQTLSTAYLGGNYAYKKILRFKENGKPVLSNILTSFYHEQTADYISSSYLNKDGSQVVYCIPLDIDAKDGATDKRWLDSEGRVEWQAILNFLQKKYPDIFQFTMFVVRSKGGKGIHLGLAISPIVKGYSEGTRRSEFLARQLQEQLIRLLQTHGIGGDWSSRGIGRDLPNWRRKKPAGLSQVHQLYFNRFVRATIKREKIDVISDLLAITNKLPECQIPAKKNQDDVIHVSKSTEPGFARLQLELFNNLGQSVFMKMGELQELTGLSKNSLRNTLHKKIKNPPKWLKSKYISKTEGYELWIDPNYGSVERAEALVCGLSVESGFLHTLPCPTLVKPGERNRWIFSALIHYKWHGYTLEETKSEVTRQATLIPTHHESESYRKIPGMVAQIFGKLPETQSIRPRDELPLVLTAGYFSKVKKQQQPRGGTARLQGVNIAFTRKENQKVVVAIQEGKVTAHVEVSGSGLIPQLRAVQSLLTCVGPVGQVVVRGNSMLQGHPVTRKFEAFHKIKFEFEERTSQDKQVLKKFREPAPVEKIVATAPRRENTAGAPRVCFNFPDIKQVKVRLDGHFEYQKAFYWLGEGWSGIKLMVLGDSGEVEVYSGETLVRKFDRLAPGEQSQVESKGPWERALEPESVYRKRSRKVGPAFDSLILEEIRKGNGVVHTGKIMGFLNLMKSWPYKELEDAAQKCLTGKYPVHLSYFRQIIEENRLRDEGEVELYLEALKGSATEGEIENLRNEYLRTADKGQMLSRIQALAAAALRKPKAGKKPVPQKRKPTNPLGSILGRFGKSLED